MKKHGFLPRKTPQSTTRRCGGSLWWKPAALALVLVAGNSLSAFGQQAVEADFHVVAPDKKPDGNFWDSALGGMFAGRARGILPDVVICANSASFRQVCAPVCQDSRECRRTLRVLANEPLTVNVVDLDIKQHDPMYRMTIKNPSSCKPCQFKNSDGTIPVTVSIAVPGGGGSGWSGSTPYPSPKPAINCPADDYAGLFDRVATACKSSPPAKLCLDARKKQADTASLVNGLKGRYLDNTPLKQRIVFLEEILAASPLDAAATKARDNLYLSNPDIYVVKSIWKSEAPRYEQIAADLSKFVAAGKPVSSQKTAQKIVDTVAKRLFGRAPTIPVVFLSKPYPSWVSKGLTAIYHDGNKDIEVVPDHFLPLTLQHHIFILVEETYHAYQYSLVHDYCAGRVTSNDKVQQARIYVLNKFGGTGDPGTNPRKRFDGFKMCGIVPVQDFTSTYETQPIEYFAKKVAEFVTYRSFGKVPCEYR